MKLYYNVQRVAYIIFDSACRINIMFSYLKQKFNLILIKLKMNAIIHGYCLGKYFAFNRCQF